MTRARLSAATAGLLALALAAAPAAVARTPAYVVYDVKVAIKGGANLSTDEGGAYTGDMVREALSASFFIDGTVRKAFLWRGTPPKGSGTSGDGYARVTFNGTWTAQGTRWIDAPNKITGPFTCGGTLGPSVEPQMHLHWRRSGTRVVFTLRALQQEIYLNGFVAGCPNDTSSAPLQGTSPDIYTGRFSVPRSALGSRTLTRTVSGPLPEHRIYWRQFCPQRSACSVAWQGTVRFRRTTLR